MKKVSVFKMLTCFLAGAANLPCYAVKPDDFVEDDYSKGVLTQAVTSVTLSASPAASVIEQMNSSLAADALNGAPFSSSDGINNSSINDLFPPLGYGEDLSMVGTSPQSSRESSSVKKKLGRKGGSGKPTIARRLFDSPGKKSGSQSTPSASSSMIENEDDSASFAPTRASLPADFSSSDSEDEIHLSFEKDSFVMTPSEDSLTDPSSMASPMLKKLPAKIIHKIFITEDDSSQRTKDDFMNQEQNRQAIHTYLSISKIKEKMAENPDFKAEVFENPTRFLLNVLKDISEASPPSPFRSDAEKEVEIGIVFNVQYCNRDTAQFLRRFLNEHFSHQATVGGTPQKNLILNQIPEASDSPSQNLYLTPEMTSVSSSTYGAWSPPSPYGGSPGPTPLETLEKEKERQAAEEELRRQKELAYEAGEYKSQGGETGNTCTIQ